MFVRERVHAWAHLVHDARLIIILNRRRLLKHCLMLGHRQHALLIIKYFLVPRLQGFAHLLDGLLILVILRRSILLLTAMPTPLLTRPALPRMLADFSYALLPIRLINLWHFWWDYGIIHLLPLTGKCTPPAGLLPLFWLVIVLEHFAFHHVDFEWAFFFE